MHVLVVLKATAKLQQGLFLLSLCLFQCNPDSSAMSMLETTANKQLNRAQFIFWSNFQQNTLSIHYQSEHFDAIKAFESFPG